MWPWRRRKPLSAKASGAYHVRMADTLGKSLADGPAVPVTLTVSRDSGHWVLRVWYHGHTIMEALHPLMLAERWLDHVQVPVNARWVDVYRAVAIAIEDLATGEVDRVHGG